MADIRSYTSDLAFTPSVKALQTRRGSRDAYARMEMNGSWETRVSPDLALFIEAQTSVFLGTANTEGQPYIQHRGGPPGFLRILDDQTIGCADFRSSRRARSAHRRSRGGAAAPAECGRPVNAVMRSGQ